MLGQVQREGCPLNRIMHEILQGLKAQTWGGSTDCKNFSHIRYPNNSGCYFNVYRVHKKKG